MMVLEMAVERFDDSGNAVGDAVSQERINNIMSVIDTIQPPPEELEKETYDEYVKEIMRQSGEKSELVVRTLLWDLCFLSNHVDKINALIRLG